MLEYYNKIFIGEKIALLLFIKIDKNVKIESKYKLFRIQFFFIIVSR